MPYVNKSEKGRPVTIFDEGVALTTNVSSLDFTGAGVTATALGANVTSDIPGATGDVVGPGSSTDNAIARFDGLTGKLLQNSSATIDDDGNITLTQSAGAVSSRIFTATGGAVTGLSGNYIDSYFDLSRTITFSTPPSYPNGYIGQQIKPASLSLGSNTDIAIGGQILYAKTAAGSVGQIGSSVGLLVGDITSSEVYARQVYSLAFGVSGSLNGVTYSGNVARGGIRVTGFGLSINLGDQGATADFVDSISISTNTITASTLTATVNRAAALYIEGVSTLSGTAVMASGVVPYSIFVDAGPVRFDADLRFGASTTVTAAQSQILLDSGDGDFMHFNVPTGKGFELSVNDSPMITVGATGLTRLYGYLGIGLAPTTIPLDILLSSSNAAFVPIQRYNVTDIATGRQDVITFSGGATSNRGMQITVQELTSGGVDTGFGISGFKFFLNEVRMFHEGAYYLSFWSTNLERMRILATGEMGLGITTPTAKLHIKQVVATSGTAKSLIVDNFNHTGQTASTEIHNVAFNTYTRTWAAGALTTQRENIFYAPTYAFASASTITTAATLAIEAAPIAGTNATITTPLSLWVQAGTSLFNGEMKLTHSVPTFTIKDSVNSGANTYIPGIFFSTSTDVLRAGIHTNRTVTGALSIINYSGSPNGNIHFRSGGTYDNIIDSFGRWSLGSTTATAFFNLVPAAIFTSGTNPTVIITPAAHTGQTASTEISNILVNTYTRQWATGAITTQREVLFSAPTYAFVGASTMTIAASVAINKAPIQGTNATITNGVGLMIGDPVTSVTSAIAGDVFMQVIAPEGIDNGVGAVSGRTGLLVTSGASGQVAVGNQTATLDYYRGIAIEAASLVSTTNTRTVTTASSLYIEGAPSNGGNVTFTNGPYALFVDGGVVRLDNAVHFGYVAKTANYTLDSTDFTVECTTNSFTITLPTAVGCTGRVYNIKNSGAATTITMNTTSGQTIDGSASGVLTIASLENMCVQSNGANWIII